MLWRSVTCAGTALAAASGPLFFLIVQKGSYWEGKVQIRGSVPEVVLWRESRFNSLRAAQVAVIKAANEILTDAIVQLVPLLRGEMAEEKAIEVEEDSAREGPEEEEEEDLDETELDEVTGEGSEVAEEDSEVEVSVEEEEEEDEEDDDEEDVEDGEDEDFDDDEDN